MSRVFNVYSFGKKLSNFHNPVQAVLEDLLRIFSGITGRSREITVTFTTALSILQSSLVRRKVFDLYSGDTAFESRPNNQLS
jgi:hypothetical protein